ncbi:restriction endonuclease subunit S [Marinomonas transparens]|uniref:Restriction endonuclease subunit S n=1 Tax=Marinomonas transparens TaxID=2795388 RepID=A0A934MWD6_9GAMM|nr:restriction endonuclease subunit S [Marinomonas transparens]MBJ7538059.1 restriction endonuclease subunit S [Marinomonas transparens]
MKTAQNTVPELRFPEFGGRFWEGKRIFSLVEKVSDPVAVDIDRVYREIGIRSHGKGVFHKEPILGKALGDKRVFWVNPKAFVINIVFAWEQSVALTSEAEQGFIASHRFLMLLPKNGQTCLEFMLYFFKRKRGKYLLGLASPGGAGRNKTLGQNEFLNLTVLFPAVEEQQKIASFLTSIDDKLTKLCRKRELLNDYKRGLMQQLFSQTLRFKQDDGSEFAEWESDEFRVIAKRVSESYNSSIETVKYPAIELESLDQGSGKILNVFNSLDQKSIKTLFKQGDVLFGKLRPYLNKFAKPNFDGVCSSEIWVLRGKKITNDFLFFVVQTSRFQKIVNIQSGSKMPRADWNTVADSVFLYPCPTEQQKIADCLSSFDAKIDAVAQQIKQLETFKKGLLQKMFV